MITPNNWVNPKLNHIINQICISCKIISNKLNRAPFDNLYGDTSNKNTSGDKIKKLDQISNEIFINQLKICKKINTLISEEEKNPLIINKNGKYIVSYDPLDGSSNLEQNINVGTIFAIYKIDTGKNKYINSARNFLLSGYCLYGSNNVMILADKLKMKVSMFVLDITYGEYKLINPNIRIPTFGNTYSINEAYSTEWFKILKEFIDNSKKYNNNISARYIGSMVADIHRTLLVGGIFINPREKLRYLYEVGPMSYIIEMAGGLSISIYENYYADILDYIPSNIHEKISVCMGSIENVQELINYYY